METDLPWEVHAASACSYCQGQGCINCDDSGFEYFAQVPLREAKTFMKIKKDNHKMRNILMYCYAGLTGDEEMKLIAIEEIHMLQNKRAGS